MMPDRIAMPDDAAGVVVDHIIPKAHPDCTDDLVNLQALHRSCNASKGAKPMSEAPYQREAAR